MITKTKTIPTIITAILLVYIVHLSVPNADAAHFVPSAPSDFSVTVNSDCSVTGTWDAQTGATKYDMQHATAGTSFSPVLGTTTVDSPITSATTSVLADGSYDLRVRGKITGAGAHTSDFTAAMTVTVSCTVPPADTTSPSVTSITVSDAFITDADDPSTFTVTVTYSEAMNTAVTPTITFDPDVSDTLTFASGSWNLAGTAYTASYDIDVDSEEVTGVDVCAEDAEDAANNVQDPNPGCVEDLFDIDTVNPSVVDITVSDAFITQSDTGSTFTVTVTYSEAMNTTVTPTITFDPSVASTLTSPGGSWTSSTVYEATYTVADANVIVSDVDVCAEDAEDSPANNVQDPNPGCVEDLFDVDTLTLTFGSGFLPPLQDVSPADGTADKTFKRGSVIPVKFQVLDAAGAPIGPLSGTISITSPPTVLGTPGSTETLRYDSVAGQYITNWSTKVPTTLPAGSYTITVTMTGVPGSLSIVVVLVA